MTVPDSSDASECLWLLIGRLQHILSMAGQQPAGDSAVSTGSVQTTEQTLSLPALPRRIIDVHRYRGVYKVLTLRIQGTGPRLRQRHLLITFWRRRQGWQGNTMEASFSRRNGRKWRCCDNRFFAPMMAQRAIHHVAPGSWILTLGFTDATTGGSSRFPGGSGVSVSSAGGTPWNVLATRNCSPNR
jgi:hypothetical protein